MKKQTVLAISLILLITACSGEKPQLVLFSPEAFAYTLDEGWEVNATVGARGFQQNEENDSLFASISYTIDMITPDDTITAVDSGIMEESNEEEFLDLMIEAQFELDRGFSEGEYKLLFFVEDNFSKTKDTADVKFNLTWE